MVIVGWDRLRFAVLHATNWNCCSWPTVPPNWRSMRESTPENFYSFERVAVKHEQRSLKPCFSYFFHTVKKKALSVSGKCLIQLVFLVGSTSFELVTPAV